MVTEAGIRSTSVLEEAGIYQLIFSSKLESAEKFQDWVFSEVLPRIRKTGSYSLPQSQSAVPAIAPNVLAVEIAHNVRDITDTLSDNPRLAQLLIDHALTSIRALPDSTPGLIGVVEVATRLGFKTDHSSRVKLGNFVADSGLTQVKEKRLCNGSMRDINCYQDTKQLEDVVTKFFS